MSSSPYREQGERPVYPTEAELERDQRIVSDRIEQEKRELNFYLGALRTAILESQNFK